MVLRRFLDGRATFLGTRIYDFSFRGFDQDLRRSLDCSGATVPLKDLRDDTVFVAMGEVSPDAYMKTKTRSPPPSFFET